MSGSIEFPLKPGKSLSLGLKPLDPSEWIEIDANFADQIALKTQLLSDRRNEVFVSLPQSVAAQQEVLDLLIAHLLKHYPQQYQQQGDKLHHCLTEHIWNLSDFVHHPLELAGRLVQEDWCVLLPQSGLYILAAGSVCFPSRWCLQDKLGQSLDGIHAPVPGYAEKLARPVESLFDRLRTDYPSVRYNWSIVDTPNLFLPASHHEAANEPTLPAPTLPIENAGERLWLRMERQTLRRLPATGGIVFGIHTTTEPLHQVKSNRETASLLAEAIEQLPPATIAYKSLLPLQSVLLSYLRSPDDNIDPK